MFVWGKAVTVFKVSKYFSLQKRLYQILRRAEFGDNLSKAADIFLTALALVNVMAVTLEVGTTNPSEIWNIF